MRLLVALCCISMVCGYLRKELDVRDPRWLPPGVSFNTAPVTCYYTGPGGAINNFTYLLSTERSMTFGHFDSEVTSPQVQYFEKNGFSYRAIRLPKIPSNKVVTYVQLLSYSTWDRANLLDDRYYYRMPESYIYDILGNSTLINEDAALTLWDRFYDATGEFPSHDDYMVLSHSWNHGFNAGDNTYRLDSFQVMLDKMWTYTPGRYNWKTVPGGIVGLDHYNYHGHYHPCSSVPPWITVPI